jgi:hypothetical protein
MEGRIVVADSGGAGTGVVLERDRSWDEDRRGRDQTCSGNIIWERSGPGVKRGGIWLGGKDYEAGLQRWVGEWDLHTKVKLVYNDEKDYGAGMQ